MNATEIQEDMILRINKGAKMLDEYGPIQWEQLIDLEYFDMNECSECALGQLYQRSFAAGAQHLLNFYPAQEIDHVFWPTFTPANGFPQIPAAEDCITYYMDQYTSLWSAYIRARLLPSE